MNNQNLLLDYKDITDESGDPTEPISLQVAKDYLRLEGWQGEDESGSEFEFDDDLISVMITAARMKAESFCGISIISHTWKVLLTNCAGDFELPFGPVIELTSIKNKNDDDISSYKLRGFSFQFLEYPRQELLTLEYTAGYDEVPAEIILAITQMVWYWYNIRGTIDATSFQAGISNVMIPEIALATLRPFKRAWTWLA